MDIISFVMPAITILLFLLFLFIYLRNKARISSGFFFTCFLVSAGITFLLFAINSQNRVLMLFVFAIAFMAGLVLLFGIYVLIALLLFNARAMLKREKRSLANCLTLIAALALLLWLILTGIASQLSLPAWVRHIQSSLTAVFIYYFFHIYLFLSSLFLCNLARPRLRQDYIVVLGSGLIKGKVPPLLAGRIERAIRFYHRQEAKRTPPKLVFSGGQGTDEPMAEAVAMRAYAREKGIPEAMILVEDLSRNTQQNMQYAKHVLDADAKGKPYRSIFATSNYHLLRAGIYAREAGLPMDGIGSRTALYYLPTALLREYIAFFRLYLKTHILVAVLLFAVTLLLNFMPEIITLLQRFLFQL